MEKEKSKLGVGALVLFVSGVICKFLGAFFRMPLTNLLGLEGIGVFQLIMAIYSFALVLVSGGTTLALTKLISTARAKGEEWKISIYVKRALLVGVGTGILLGSAFALVWKSLSIFQGIEPNRSYWLFLLLLPLGSVIASLRGYFQGNENMLPTAISQIVEQAVKFVFGLLFAYLLVSSGVQYGVLGAFVGVTLGELIAFVVILIWFLAKRGKSVAEKDIKDVQKEFDKTNIMLLLSSAILPLVNAFDGVMIVPRLVKAGFLAGDATQLFGLQSGVVGTVLNFPLIISLAVTTAMLPNFSYLVSKGKLKKHIIEKGLKILLLCVLPTTFGLVAISKQLLPIFYVALTEEVLDTMFNLMLFGAFAIVFAAIMQYFSTLLLACGEFKFNLFITLGGGVLKGGVSVILAGVPSVNIYALIFGNIAIGAFVSLLAIVKLKKIVSINLAFGEVFDVLFSTATMFAVVYSFLQGDPFGRILNLAVAVLLGILTYVVFAIPLILKIFPKKRSKGLKPAPDG